MTDLAIPQIAWRKSSFSGGNGNCVEAAPTSDAIAARDSKNPDGPRLDFGVGEWAAFVRALLERPA